MDKTVLKLELEAFQGPFDLLLHLIRQLKIDINDIPMTEITTQYMVYLKTMQELHLDVAGEYLVMAATLLEIKARMLLPIEPEAIIEGEYEGDPREVLVQQLLLYQQFQHVATALQVKEAKRMTHFNRPMEDLSHFQEVIPLGQGEITLTNLMDAMYHVLQKVAERIPKQREIQTDPMTVSEKIDWIKQQLTLRTGKCSFESLLQTASKDETITTFMAVLEMVRKQQIVFFQSSPLAPIEIESVS